MITASALDLLAACPSSAALDQVREESTFMRTGTVVHKFLELANIHGREEALARTDPEFQVLCAALDLDTLPVSSSFAAEVAFALAPAMGTARELGRGMNRDYSSVQPWEIPGTPDAVALVDDDAVYVGDYKVPGRQTAPCAENWQMRFNGLSACRAYGRSRAILEIIHVDPDTGAVWRDRAELDAFALAEFEDKLRKLLLRIGEARGAKLRSEPLKLNRGSWCYRCPSFRTCPGTAAVARQLVDYDPQGGMTWVSDIRNALTPETAPQAYERLREVRKVLDAVEKELKDWAKVHPIQVGKKTYGPRPWSERKVDPAKALPVLVDLLGAEKADAIFPRKASVTAIEAAVKELAVSKGEKVAPFQRQVMARLEAAGAVVTETTEQIREH